jgi:integrase
VLPLSERQPHSTGKFLVLGLETLATERWLTRVNHLRLHAPTAASLLLNQNVPLPIVSRYLGHANSGVTARMYAHMIDGTSGIAASGMDEALGQG